MDVVIICGMPPSILNSEKYMLWRRPESVGERFDGSKTCRQTRLGASLLLLGASDLIISTRVAVPIDRS